MGNNTSKPNSRELLAEWLEKIQQDSWQLELLISGLALYGIYNGIEKIEDFSSFIELHSTNSTIGFILFLAHGVVFIGWRIFFFNLLIHVILRGLWIASIGLRYVSNEINFDELDYAPSYSTYLKEKIGTYDEFIEKLEKLCSIIFAFTFLVFLLLISISVFIFSVLAPILYFQTFHGWSLIIFFLILLYFLLGLIVAIDFISLGSIKKIRDPWVVKIFSPIFKFYSYLTLSFMYRPILYNFLDQKYTRKFFILAIPYVIVLGSFDSFFSNHIYPYKDSEESLAEEGLIISDFRYKDLLNKRVEFMNAYERKRYINLNVEYLILSNYHIRNGKLEFFVRTDRNFSEFLLKKHGVEPLYKEGLQFNLFVNHEKENNTILEIKKKYAERYISLRKKYSLERDSLTVLAEENENEQILKNKRRLINNTVDSLENLKEKEISDYKKNYNEDVFEKFVSTIGVKIDSIDYTDLLSCKYFIDPLIGTEGILCNLNDAILPKGNKILEYTKEYYNENEMDSIATSTIKIPLYIE